MEFAGYYDASYPPELWETPAAPVALARESATDEGGTVPAGTVPPLPAAENVQVSGTLAVPGEPLPELPADAYPADAVDLPVGLTVTAGQPGSYSPAQSATERPRNVTELTERATPATGEPWQPGEYVQVGERGKRAHWDGEAWRSGEAPPFQSRARRR